MRGKKEDDNTTGWGGGGERGWGGGGERGGGGGGVRGGGGGGVSGSRREARNFFRKPIHFDQYKSFLYLA